MNKIIILVYFLIYSLIGFSQVQQQQPTNCPTIVFTYDHSGNRITRQLVVNPCGGGGNGNSQRTTDTTKKDTPSLSIKVYPNPTNDKVNISLSQDSLQTVSDIALYDISGRTVYSTKTSSLQVQIDVSTFNAGVYLLKIARGKKYATFNVMKN